VTTVSAPAELIADDVGETADAPPDRILVNRTNKHLEIDAPDGTRLVLPPLAHLRTSADLLARLDLEPLRARGLVALEAVPVAAGRGAAVLGSAFWIGIAFVLYGIGSDRGAVYWLAGAGGLAAFAVLAWRALDSGAWTRWLAQSASLTFVLGVGLLLPAAAIWFAGDVGGVWGRVFAEGEAAPSDVQTLVWRALQVLFIALASLVPGLLYFLFDRECLWMLRDRFTRQIFRFDRSIQTCADVEAKYGAQLDEAYGPADRGATRLQPGTIWPVHVATVTLAFGWVLTMVNIDTAGGSAVKSLGDVVVPGRTAVTFAFLGAYFFSLHVILRGYARGDLRPKTYSYVVVRVLTVIVLAWMLEALGGPSKGILAVSFLTGIVPDVALYRLREFARAAGASRRELNSLFERLPLTALDGIDLYDRARLESEGVTNVESLAHHDIVELMLKTRVPVPRLVDWTDQAVLYLHLGVDTAGRDEQGRSALDLLRRHGIRTATDLEAAYAAAKARGKEAEGEFLDLLPTEGDGDPPRLRFILDTIADDEWMDALRFWRTPPDPATLTRRFKAGVEIDAPAPIAAPAGAV
jgi:hypothetical protein